MTDDELIAAAAPLLRQLLERDLLRVRFDSDDEAFTVLLAESSAEHHTIGADFMGRFYRYASSYFCECAHLAQCFKPSLLHRNRVMLLCGWTADSIRCKLVFSAKAFEDRPR